MRDFYCKIEWKEDIMGNNIITVNDDEKDNARFFLNPLGTWSVMLNGNVFKTFKNKQSAKKYINNWAKNTFGYYA